MGGSVILYTSLHILYSGEIILLTEVYQNVFVYRYLALRSDRILFTVGNINRPVFIESDIPRLVKRSTISLPSISIYPGNHLTPIL